MRKKRQPLRNTEDAEKAEEGKMRKHKEMKAFLRARARA